MDELLQALIGDAPASAARRDLPGRRVLRATGSDRVRFLNGMITADVAKLGVGDHAPALQLDRKGHVLAELEAIALADAVLLDIAPGGEEIVHEMLAKHLIADDVELERLGEAWRGIALEGAGAVAAAQGAGAPVGCAGVDERGIVWCPGGSLLEAGARALGPRDAVDALWDSLAELPELASDAAEVLRIEVGRPDLARDADERSFPEELGRLDAVSFDKGCYIGQEIVARIHSRGAVNRFLVRLALDAAVEPGTALTHDGREVGRVSSVALSPRDGVIALGTVRKNAAEPGTALQAGEVAARVRPALA